MKKPEEIPPEGPHQGLTALLRSRLYELDLCEVNCVKQVASLTQIVLETVAGLVGVGEAGVKRSRPVVLDLLLHLVRHLQLLDICRRPTVCEQL